MGKLPERYAHFEERTGIAPASILSITDCRRAIHRTVPTRHHARRLFDAVLERLGERAVLDDAGAPDLLAIHVRDAREPYLVVGSPLVTLARGPGTEHVVATFVNPAGLVPEDAPEGWTPGDPPWQPPSELEPEILPRGPEMCGGKITISEGHSSFGVEYDARGVRAGGTETAGDLFSWGRRPGAPYQLDTLARPPSHPPLSVFSRPALSAAGHDARELAALLLSSAIEERVGWRVHLPVPVPTTIEALVRAARHGLRFAAFSGKIPDSARWAVADGLEGKAVAWGETVQDALAAFQREAFAKKPRVPGAPEPAPDPPPPPFEPPRVEKSEDGKTTVYSFGTIHLSVPGRPPPFAWPRAIPSNLPAVLVPLGPTPLVPAALVAHGFTRVVRCFGAQGLAGHVFVRDEERGFTAIGEHVADVVDLEHLEEGMAEAVAELDEILALTGTEGDELATELRATFTVFDDARRLPTPPKHDQSARSPRLGPVDLDGDRVPWRVVRERR